MPHLIVEFYDKVNDHHSYFTLDDEVENNRRYFHDLNRDMANDRAARVNVKKGDEYVIGVLKYK